MRKQILLLLAFFIPLRSGLAQSGVGGGGQSNVGAGGGSTVVSTPGVFTSTQFNTGPIYSTLTGGGTCNPNTITNLGGSTINLTDAFSACVNLPTSGVTNGFTNGFGSYMINPNANNGGQFGWTGAVGYYSQVWCRGGNASNTRCWGANFSVSDDTAKPGTLFGNEYDVTINNTTTTGSGTIYSMRGSGQPTADNFPAVSVQAPAQSAAFTSGFECANGSLAGNAQPNAFKCVSIGTQFSNGGGDSGQILWQSAGPKFADTRLLQDGFVVFEGQSSSITGWIVGSQPTGVATGQNEGLGIQLKATAALTVNTLVKVDTANADSVVVCTTTDTHCIGFVAGGAVYCAAGVAQCGVITTPGSKANGILGTGTCAIGNFVVVDTTTNGRIKCQATIPAQGAYIGDAISAQSTVGNLVDILTKFQ